METHPHRTTPHLTYGTPPGRPGRTAFIGPTGAVYDAYQIGRAAAEIGLGEAHIFAQLEGLGLRPAFDGGTTPAQLPFSFKPYTRRTP